mmetsp:Transcript_28252/g.79363  ORF Transcript_28252/g.79363 Transcript_28252/m.79363 type:complete len:257 (+) Transcript_28252:1123-1893(+)
MAIIMFQLRILNATLLSSPPPPPPPPPPPFPGTQKSAYVFRLPLHPGMGSSIVRWTQTSPSSQSSSESQSPSHSPSGSKSPDGSGPRNLASGFPSSSTRSFKSRPSGMMRPSRMWIKPFSAKTSACATRTPFTVMEPLSVLTIVSSSPEKAVKVEIPFGMRAAVLMPEMMWAPKILRRTSGLSGKAAKILGEFCASASNTALGGAKKVSSSLRSRFVTISLKLLARDSTVVKDPASTATSSIVFPTHDGVKTRSMT